MKEDSSIEEEELEKMEQEGDERTTLGGYIDP